MSDQKINWYLNQIKLGINKSEAVKNIYQLCSGKSEDMEFVDLGLPSGTLWGSCNLGASKPEEFGNFYQWGDTVPYKAQFDEEGNLIPDYMLDEEGNKLHTQDWYELSALYKHSVEYSEEVWSPIFSKYNSNQEYGETDYKYKLDPEDDVATLTNSEWRYPSPKEIEELLEYTENITPSDASVYGPFVITLKSKVNGNIIHFSATPWDYSEGRILFWSNTLNNGNYSGQANAVECLAYTDPDYLYVDTKYSYGDFHRIFPKQVRPVKGGNNNKDVYIEVKSVGQGYQDFSKIAYAAVNRIPVLLKSGKSVSWIQNIAYNGPNSILPFITCQAYVYGDYNDNFPSLHGFIINKDGSVQDVTD